MFGYISPLKDDLKVAQYQDFRSYYCGLCQHIKRDFGELPRLALNYDLTTLAILLDGLSPTKTYRTYQPCITNPIKRKPMITSNDALRYAAQMNVSLTYYKLLDDRSDEKDLNSLLREQALKPYTKKLSPQVRALNQLIATQLHDLATLEASGDFTHLDAISHPSAMLVALILKYYPHALHKDSPALREQLFNFGYALGQWIYLIDALDDLEKDFKKGRFNPLITLYSTEGMSYEVLRQKVKEPISFAILSAAARCQELFNTLPLVRNRAILNNIISLGLMHQYTRVVSKGQCTTCTSSKVRRS